MMETQSDLDTPTGSSLCRDTGHPAYICEGRRRDPDPCSTLRLEGWYPVVTLRESGCCFEGQREYALDLRVSGQSRRQLLSPFGVHVSPLQFGPVAAFADPAKPAKPDLVHLATAAALQSCGLAVNSIAAGKADGPMTLSGYGDLVDRIEWIETVRLRHEDAVAEGHEIDRLSGIPPSAGP